MSAQRASATRLNISSKDWFQDIVIAGKEKRKQPQVVADRASSRAGGKYEKQMQPKADEKWIHEIADRMHREKVMVAERERKMLERKHSRDVVLAKVFERFHRRFPTFGKIAVTLLPEWILDDWREAEAREIAYQYSKFLHIMESLEQEVMKNAPLEFSEGVEERDHKEGSASGHRKVEVIHLGASDVQRWGHEDGPFAIRTHDKSRREIESTCN